jgi:hypothetical protein
VAEDGALSCGEDGGHPPPVAGKLPVADGVDAPMDRM